MQRLTAMPGISVRDVAPCSIGCLTKQSVRGKNERFTDSPVGHEGGDAATGEHSGQV